MRLILLWLIALAVVGCGGSTPQPQTSLETQSIQQRDFEATKEVTFGATMSVLQDLGYIVEAADSQTGFLMAKGTTQKTRMLVDSQPKVTGYIERISDERTRVRLNFVVSQAKQRSYGRVRNEDEAITDPAIYQSAFNKIGEAVFIRNASQ